MWLCSCGGENTLTHYQGQRPFKLLKCRKCADVLYERSQKTQILTTASVVAKLFGQRPKSTTATKGVLYCRVYRSCGLSQCEDVGKGSLGDGRLIRYAKKTCLCGEPAGARDANYFIGSVHEYRKDSQTRIIKMRVHRLDDLSNRPA
jgi:hypothetical protein